MPPKTIGSRAKKTDKDQLDKENPVGKKDEDEKWKELMKEHEELIKNDKFSNDKKNTEMYRQIM